MLDFENYFEIDQIKSNCKNTCKRTPFMTVKNQKNIKRLNYDLVRIGFMMVLEKLKNDKANHLINEIKCMKDIMGRENSNLNDLGYDYVGV